MGTCTRVAGVLLAFSLCTGPDASGAGYEIERIALDGETAPDAGGPTYDEPIRKPVIQVNGDLASVWVEYQVRLEPGKVHHCGYDSFQMARLGGRWRILNVSDTYTEEGCGPAWP